MPDLYMIVNPSDPYTIQGDRETVCAAVLLLGEGAWLALTAALAALRQCTHRVRVLLAAPGSSR